MLSKKRCCCGNPPGQVTGCGGVALITASIEIYDTQGGTLLETDTTDASGFVTPSISGSYWMQDGTGRLGNTVTIPSASYVLAPLSGYACFTPCNPYPIATTLNITDSVFGAWTLTYVPASLWWNGTKSITSGTCCFAATPTTTFGRITAGGVFTQGVSVPIWTDNPMVVTCSPFNYGKTFSQTVNCGSSGWAVWCVTSHTITVTE